MKLALSMIALALSVPECPLPCEQRCGDYEDNDLDGLADCEDKDCHESSYCKPAEPARCGDGALDADETCDDGNTRSGDGCSAECRCEIILEPVVCGDGIADKTEECDEGEDNSDTEPDACREDCTLPICGDGVVDSGEECDDPPTLTGGGCKGCQIIPPIL
jgi:cysteine-rich repeat protein